MPNLRAKESQRWALYVDVWKWEPDEPEFIAPEVIQTGVQVLISLPLFLGFSFFPCLFPCCCPSPRPCPTQQTSLCGMHDIQLNNNHKKRVLEFRAPVVSMQGQLQTWISLQIKESLWGPNPVRHSLGRLYKGSTLNPRRVQLNEITPVDVWHIVILHLFFCIPPSQGKRDGWGGW